IGCGQLEVLEDRVQSRRENYNFYVKELQHKFKFLEAPKGYFSNRWLTCMLTESYGEREQIRLALQEQQIESRPLWKPMHLQPIFKKYPRYVNGVSENLFEKGLCLPSGSNLSNSDLTSIKDILKEF
ncbi:MAG: DegT/DnrJ/EryC1/StrS family aminotransferase, partial [Lutibacter sp.]|nr:DegT/DnrJ/EryC1/StrS family aminotransferase [Lutibacter sp.]